MEFRGGLEVLRNFGSRDGEKRTYSYTDSSLYKSMQEASFAIVTGNTLHNGLHQLRDQKPCFPRRLVEDYKASKYKGNCAYLWDSS